MMQPDIVAIGECLVEFVQLPDGTYRQSYAGDTLNTLFYASRLGQKTGYVSAFGSDPFTMGAIDLLDRETIDRRLVANDDGFNGVYYVLDAAGTKRYHFLRRHSAATRALEHLDGTRLRNYIRDASVLHVSLTAIGIQSYRDGVIKLLEKVTGDVKITLDSNYRAPVWGSPEIAREYYERALPYVSMLFVTDTDHRAMYGDDDLISVIKRYQSFGVDRLAYRMGEKGSVLFDGKAQTIKAMEGLSVVDTTGAGDAYNAGFIHSMLSGRTFAECGTFATACAAVAIEEEGGMAKGFSKEKVEQKLKEAKVSE